MSEDRRGGLQVRLAVDAVEACPVAGATAGDHSATGVTWSRATDGDVTEEFDLVGPGATEVTEDRLPDDADVVFAADDTARVRFSRDGAACICDRIERHGPPVLDVRATRGTLRMSFHANEVETVREVITDLREDYDVRIDRLTKTGPSEDDDLVVVDRGRLTDRQLEVLETAMAMGYFKRPREANATEVAAELGISPSTYAEHLATAQSKVLEGLLERAP